MISKIEIFFWFYFKISNIDKTDGFSSELGLYLNLMAIKQWLGNLNMYIKFALYESEIRLNWRIHYIF